MGNKGHHKLTQRQKAYKEVLQRRTATTTPPVQYTRRLKSRKHKKLKCIDTPGVRKGAIDNPPKDDSQHMPASFKQFLEIKGKTKLPRKRSLPSKGMKKPDKVNLAFKKGKRESDFQYFLRMDKLMQDELTRMQYAKEQKTRLLSVDEVKKSRKKVKSVKRLKDKKIKKSLVLSEKRRSGYEHLKDKVQFNEVVMAPPVGLTLPKKVGGRRIQTHMIDKHLAT